MMKWVITSINAFLGCRCPQCEPQDMETSVRERMYHFKPLSLSRAADWFVFDG